MNGIVKLTIAVFLFCLPTLYAGAQGNILRQEFKKNISFIRLDSTYKAQSTVIEYDDFLVLLELPAIEKSSDRKSKSSKETAQGQKYLDYLTAKYEKPVKYVFCSHSHLHTLSGILPFLQADSKIVTTTKNWQTSVKSGILSSEYIDKFSEKIISVDNDTTFLKESDYPIDLIYLDSASVYFTPTEDYIMFYLKKDKVLHASCLAWIKDLDYSKLKEYTYNSRLDGLFKAIRDKKLNPEAIIRLEHNTLNNPNEVQYAYLTKKVKLVMNNAMPVNKMIEHYININENILVNSQDSLINIAIAQQLHPNLIRIATLENLKAKNYSKAIQLAIFLNLYFPGSPKYIDVLGECYFASGNYEKALYYDSHLRKLSNSYGIEKWKNRKWGD